MTTAELELKTAKLESKVSALESELAALRERLERAEIEAAVRRGEEQISHGKTVPFREGMEALRRKHNIPAS